ncbi:ficolin-2-like isoform X1 [Drosophila elegans]|uniref:ficolin-2-like isoform X1 n=2 Tax=Drosophila elegans TaxID=30023 RepID=UPI001BC85CC3|nr:ficolin-2-like isoform X1 [Drosophila elegans]
MLSFGIFFSLLFLNTLANQNGKEVCTLLTICDNLVALKYEVAAIREEQKRQAVILEGLDKKFDLCVPNSYPASCAETSKNKLVIRVPEYSENPFEVTCDQESHGGGWTVVMRRNDGSQDFFLEWKDYKEGFGQLNNEFFMRMDKLHAMTASEPQELLVLLEDYKDDNRYQLYENFKIGPESNNYTLESLGSSNGDAGDSLIYHLGMQFSTKDRKNDIDPTAHCAELFTGAWWYRACHKSHLFGMFGDNWSGRGIVWDTFGYNTSYLPYNLKRAAMMIRPKRISSNRS